MSCKEHVHGCVVLGSRGLRVPFRPKSDAEREQYRREEDLQFGAVDTLEDTRKAGGVDAMMEALPTVAKHYKFDRDLVLKRWAKHYGPTLMFEALKDTGHPNPLTEAMRLWEGLKDDDQIDPEI